MTTENYELIRHLANLDVDQLISKGKKYGRSWIRRGGVGAFMMLARKWDRIENDSVANGYDIVQAIKSDPSATGLLDDIKDLRAYLLLVEAEVRGQLTNEVKAAVESFSQPASPGGPTLLQLPETQVDRLNRHEVEQYGRVLAPEERMDKLDEKLIDFSNEVPEMSRGVGDIAEIRNNVRMAVLTRENEDKSCGGPKRDDDPVHDQ